jgi:hypothetical protein
MESVKYRRQQIARRERRQQKTSIVSIVVGIAGILLLAGAFYLYMGGQQQTASGSTEYTEADVAHEGAFVAQHEMGEGPPIPFLPAGDPQPRVTVPETSYNFGRIGPQDVVERNFIVRNEGEAPLTISRAYTTCGCTTAEFSASVIPPGKVATVKVIFDAGFHDTAGQTVRRGVIIENNDPNQSQAEIWVQAAVNLK